MADDCVSRLTDPEVVKSLFGDKKVPKGVLEKLVADIEALKMLDDVESFQSRVGKYIKEKRELNAIERGVKATNLRKAKERMDFYSQPAFAKDPLEGLKSMLTFSKFLAKGGRDSMEGRMQALNSKYKNFLFAGLEDKGLRKLFLSGEIDEQVHIATEALALGKKPEGVGPQAMEIATVVNDINKKFFQDMRDAGVPVRFLEGYIGAQTHNIDKIRDTGFETWKAKVMPLLDQKKTFGVNAGDAKKMDKALQKMHQAILGGRVGADSGIGGDEIEDLIKNTGFTRSLNDKLSESRFLRFKDAKSTHSYNAEFGRGNMAENLAWDINKRTRMLGAVQKFGSNPEASIQADMDRMETKFRREGNSTGVEAIRRGRADIDTMFREVMGETSIPGRNTLAKVGRNIRIINTLSKLGNAGIRSISNFATGAIELKTQTGKNFLEAHWDLANAWVKSHGSKGDYYARKMGFFLGDMNAEFLNAGMADHMDTGLGARSMRTMFKLNGLSALSDGMRVAYGRVIMEEMHENISKDFGKIDTRLQATLLTNGIDAADFKVLKNAVEVMPDGRKMVTAEGVGKIDPALVKGEALAKKMSPAAYIRELELKYASYIIQGANVASTSAGSRERNIINAGTMTGTAAGEIRRLLGQFKSFALQAHFISQQILNSKPDEQALLKGVVMSGGKDFVSMGQFLMSATVLGYIGQALIDTANGDGIDDPRDPQTWVESMVKGGAGGLYTDFLAGEYNKYSFAENMLGPTGAQVLGSVPKLIATAKDTVMGAEAKYPNPKPTWAEVGKQSMKLVRNNIPFQNFPLAKQAFDKLQYDVIMESVKPGYSKRSQAYQKRSNRDKIGPLGGE